MIVFFSGEEDNCVAVLFLFVFSNERVCLTERCFCLWKFWGAFLDLVFVLQLCKAVSFGGLGGFSLSVCSVTGIICNHGRKQGEKDESGFHGRDVAYCLKSESWSVSVQHTVKAEIKRSNYAAPATYVLRPSDHRRLKTRRRTAGKERRQVVEQL